MKPERPRTLAARPRRSPATSPTPAARRLRGLGSVGAATSVALGRSVVRLDSLSLAEPLGEGRQHPPTDDRHVLDQSRELTRAEHEESHVALRGDRGGARRRVKESHLAEALARAELGASLAADCRLRSTLIDHESLSPRIALADQHPARGDLDLFGEERDAGKIPLAAGGEKLDLREPLDLGVGPPSCRSLHRREYPTFRALNDAPDQLDVLPRHRLLPLARRLERFRVAVKPAHLNRSAVAKGPDFAMGARDLYARPSTATPDLTERNYLVAAVNDALGFEANLLPGGVDAPDRLIEAVDPLSAPALDGVVRIHPFHVLCQHVGTELAACVPLLIDAVEPLDVLSRHRLLPQSGGFEGFLLRSVGVEVGHLPTAKSPPCTIRLVTSAPLPRPRAICRATTTIASPASMNSSASTRQSKVPRTCANQALTASRPRNSLPWSGRRPTARNSISGSANSSMSSRATWSPPRLTVSMHRRTNSTFSCDIAYSRSPTASRASSRLGNISRRAGLPSRIVQRCPIRFSTVAGLPVGRILTRTNTTIRSPRSKNFSGSTDTSSKGSMRSSKNRLASL